MWDWNFVGELTVGLALGIGLGGWIFSHYLEIVGLRIAGHQSVRKLANAADRFSGQAGVAVNSWPGLLGGIVNWLSGGRAFAGLPGSPQQRTVVVDAEGRIIGETIVDPEKGGR